MLTAGRRHGLMTALLLGGLILRVVSQLAYRPALLYIDSAKYLLGAWPGRDPVGYQVPLKLILAAGNLATVAAVQHGLGLTMAVVLYRVLCRRGCPGWLAALATAPLLLDAYQLQMEQTIMPDVWFEALIVAGLAALLWSRRSDLRLVVTAGLALGGAATVRQIGEVALLPALIYVLAVAAGWRQKARQTGALSAAFVLPILACCSVTCLQTGHFWLSGTGVTAFYGRAAEAADCPDLRAPAAERALCPAQRQRALGIDGLAHSPASPLQGYGRGRRSAEVAAFIAQVLTQQPLRVLSGVTHDAVRLFALTRNTRPGEPPVARWQFQRGYPVFRGTVELTSGRYFVLGPLPPTSGPSYRPLTVAIGNRAAVWAPAAALLRYYQLGGGYTPGPLQAAATLAGLAGLAGLAHRRTEASPERLDAALGCLLLLALAAAILLTADAVEFSWRYQLPALITLPPAGALGLRTMGLWRVPAADLPGAITSLAVKSRGVVFRG